MVSNFFFFLPRITSVLKFWISNHTSDFTSDPSLLTTVLEIVDVLSKDGLDHEKNKIVTAMEQKRLDTQGRKGTDAPSSPTPQSQAQALAGEEGKGSMRKRDR